MTASSESSSDPRDTWTVRRILEWTTGFLAQKGIESPRLEAELLLAHARQCPRIRIYTDIDHPLTDGQRATMRELVQQRAKRVPLAYIVGVREFYGQAFAVSPGVLIPRPETETLIDVALERIPKDRAVRLIEVGIGSACISVTLARLRPLCTIVATEISLAAAQVARSNLERHGVTDRIDIRMGSGLEPLADDGLFDGLVSNPPYIRDDERATLAPEVAEHEPHEALFAGSDGLDVVRRIASHAADRLKPGAFIVLEVDPAQCAAVGALLLNSGFEATTVRQDLNGSDRLVTAIRSPASS